MSSEGSWLGRIANASLIGLVTADRLTALRAGLVAALPCVRRTAERLARRLAAGRTGRHVAHGLDATRRPARGEVRAPAPRLAKGPLRKGRSRSCLGATRLHGVDDV